MSKKTKASDGGEGHNSQAREIALLKHIAAIREQNDKLAEVMSLAKVIKKDLKRVRNLAKEANFTLSIIDEALKIEAKGNDRETQKAAEERVFVFQCLGLPTGMRQGDLFSDLPNEALDESFWSDNGYNAGLRGMEAKPPTQMPPHLTQTWMLRHAAGRERISWAQAEQANPEKRGDGVGPTAADIASTNDDVLLQ